MSASMASGFSWQRRVWKEVRAASLSSVSLGA